MITSPFIYNPNTTSCNPVKKYKIPTWRRQLASLHGEFNFHYGYDGTKKQSVDALMRAIALMQEEFPGNYILVEEYDEALQRYDYKMQFDTPEEESLFLIRYSEQ
jgi:hypothetical protein